MPTNANPNRTALVTGAGRARGIGAATAIRLGRNGFFVTVADLVPQGEGGRTAVGGLEDTARRIEEAGGQAIVVPLDVTNRGPGARSGPLRSHLGLVRPPIQVTEQGRDPTELAGVHHFRQVVADQGDRTP